MVVVSDWIGIVIPDSDRGSTIAGTLDSHFRGNDNANRNDRYFVILSLTGDLF